MPAELVLLPSPLVGPSAWGSAAERLRDRGWVARVAYLPAPPRNASDVVAGFLESLPRDRSIVLIAQSNAGLFVPVLGRHCDVIAHVFVDAAVPPVEGSIRLAPPALLDFLEARADEEGLLPPWTDWWDDSEVDGLFPDVHMRRKVEAEQPRLPLAYFRTTVEVPTGWSDRPGGYIAFGDTYAEERRRAESWGWPVTTLPGRHLHMLVEPAAVVAAMTALLAELGVEPSG